MTAEERYEHMVAMALEAWDDEASRLWKRGVHLYEADRERFEAAVRERLAQSAQVYELDALSRWMLGVLGRETGRRS